MTKQVLVVGGGVVGLSVAYHALRKGHRVTVVEREGAGNRDGCSFGNAGLVCPSHVIPLAAPGMPAMGLRMLLDPAGPFRIRPRFDPDLIRWCALFWRASSQPHVERAAPLLAALGLESRRIFEELAEGSRGGFELVRRGLLMLCATERALREEAHLAERARSLGIPAEVLTAADTARAEPGLRMQVAGAVRFPLDAHLEPRRFVEWLEREVESIGGVFHPGTEVSGFRTEGGKVKAALTSRGEMEAEEFVLAAGSWSGRLARGLGVDFPLQAGKGYSITLPSPRLLPQMSAILVEARVAVTPMGSSLRFGGTMEVSDLEAKVTPARVRALIGSIPRFYPDLGPSDFRGIPVWCGLRPCSPDGLPYVGRLERWPNLVAAAGHAMLGLSLGPVTGKLVAEVLSEEKPSIDIALLRPERYDRSSKAACYRPFSR